ncbi:uncharacterized protein SCHCODRAFT_02283747 [Schizophyllum commune H4-8]|uniref:uncharacterized protein n=1 Tax=Schizophyllum commune (strain H4-8 / FGSC 9210) TaxID=578458 RepID=UPI002160215B|nr:uncharacterized protein SCHCODRAFT_02283747 [Schizophyllum commune H4-8]KAI5892115.1 hypothetical protein SCHCODRAFT_02283747 [Schizophyllum commune H4-8]
MCDNSWDQIEPPTLFIALAPLECQRRSRHSIPSRSVQDSTSAPAGSVVHASDTTCSLVPQLSSHQAGSGSLAKLASPSSLGFTHLPKTNNDIMRSQSSRAMRRSVCKYSEKRRREGNNHPTRGNKHKMGPRPAQQAHAIYVGCTRGKMSVRQCKMEQDGQ